MKFSFNSYLAKFNNEESKVYKLHFPLPVEISESLLNEDIKRVSCLINEKVEIRSGLMPFKSYWYILANESLRKKLKIQIGEKVCITIKPDFSKYGMDMPLELEEVLSQNSAAEKHFETLTPGKQRNLIYLITQVKNTQSRINKALAIAEHLEQSNGNLNFKILLELIKSYNDQNKIK